MRGVCMFLAALLCLHLAFSATKAMSVAKREDAAKEDHHGHDEANPTTESSAAVHADHENKEHEQQGEENEVDGLTEEDSADHGDDENGNAEAVARAPPGPLNKEQQELLDALLKPLPQKPKPQSAPPSEHGEEEEFEDENEEIRPDEEDVPSWEAGRNKFTGYSHEELLQFYGIDTSLDKDVTPNNTEVITKSYGPSRIPKEFDARKKWPQCAKVINAVTDQSECGSCWANAVAYAFNTRMCIAMAKSGRQVNPNMRMSAADLMSCGPKKGCDGGSTRLAWKYIVENGIVTGGGHKQNWGCRPYPFAPQDQVPPPKGGYKTPKCLSKCTNRNYKKSYTNDKRYARDPVWLRTEPLDTSLVRNMQREIMTNGPINADMRCHDDFTEGLQAVDRVYSRDAFCRHNEGHDRCRLSKKHGYHSVTIIGWGLDQQDGKKYWLAANSWGEDWGQKGFFKILRGSDEADIESMGIAFAQPEL